LQRCNAFLLAQGDLSTGRRAKGLAAKQLPPAIQNQGRRQLNCRGNICANGAFDIGSALNGAKLIIDCRLLVASAAAEFGTLLACQFCEHRSRGADGRTSAISFGAASVLC
jgi:hypothetical protein